MGTEFRMDSIPGSLVVVGGVYEPWLSVLEQAGWRCTQCSDLRKADALFRDVFRLPFVYYIRVIDNILSLTACKSF